MYSIVEDGVLVAGYTRDVDHDSSEIDDVDRICMIACTEGGLADQALNKGMVVVP